MLRKESKNPGLKGLPTWIKVGVLAEITLVGVGYLGFRSLNRNQDSRLFMYKNCYPILNAFYWIGEKLNKNYKCRECDLEYWKANQKI